MLKSCVVLYVARFIFQFSLNARCTPCRLYLLDFVLNSCSVFHTTEAYPLVFIYMQGVFFAFRMSVGLCPQTMWCTPHYRGLSSCFSFIHHPFLLTGERGSFFYQFLFNTLPGTSTNIPISPPTLALFIAYLFDHHYASSTVNSYVSAIGYSHKLAGLHDPTKSFFINQMLKRYGKIGCRLDSRLLITLPILHRIVWATYRLSDSFFNTCRFQAMCLFAFYTFARVGEITASASGTTIYLHQVSKLVNDKQEGL